MVKNRLKIVLLSLISLIAFSMALVPLINQKSYANAADAQAGDVFFEEIDSFETVGAAVRVEGERPGLRYICSISKEEYDGLTTKYDSVKVGALIIPKNVLVGELTLENARKSGSLILNVEIEEPVPVSDSKYEFRAVLYDIPTLSFGRDIEMVGYLEISDGTYENVFYAKEITRNIAYVSYMNMEQLPESPYYGVKDNDVINGYIDSRVFHKIDVIDGVFCEYQFGYEGQVVELKAKDTNKVVSSITVSEEDVSVDEATVDLGGVDILLESGEAKVGLVGINGTVDTITDGFTYASGVLTTTKGAGEYDVEIVNTDGITYTVKVIVITKVINSYADFVSARDANTVSGVWSGYYILGADISFTGTYSSSVSSFTGVFDGRGHSFSGGTLHSGADDATKSLFGNMSGTIKNTAFTGWTFGIIAGIARGLSGTMDNCLIEGSTLDDYANESPIYNFAPEGTISNTIIYLNDANVSAGNKKGGVNMMQGTTKNVYVFSGKLTGWDNRANKTGATLYADNANLPTGLTGFNDNWDLTGTKAKFKTIEVNVDKTLDVFLNSNDGDAVINLTDLGATGKVSNVVLGNQDVDFGNANGKVIFNKKTLTAGEKEATVVADGVKYNFNVAVITKVINSYADFVSARDANTVSGVWSGYYILGADISFTGTYSSSVSSFTGVFDGRGHSFSGGTLHSGADDATKSLFGNMSGTIKNTAFTGWTFGIIAGIARGLSGTMDNCLIEGSTLGDYANESPIYNFAPEGTISNTIIYLNDANVSAGNKKGGVNMMQGTTKNVYVFSGKLTGWDNRVSKTGATLYAFNANLPTGLTGFNNYWFLDGTKAMFTSQIEVQENVANKVNIGVGDGFDVVEDLGLTAGSIYKLYDENLQKVDYTIGGNVITPTLTTEDVGEKSFVLMIDSNFYKVDATVYTKILRTKEDLVAFANGSKTGNYALGNNINAAGVTFMNTDASFTGTFDGMGYAIKGATFSSANGNKPGALFGAIAAGSVVKNLAILNATVTSENNYAWVQTSTLTGGGYCYGTIQDVFIEIVNTGASTNIAGVAQHISGAVIKNVIVKSTPTNLLRNITDMVLGTSNISNTFVIGGKASDPDGKVNTGWNQSGSPVSISRVASLSGTQQAGFNSDIWGFNDGIPYFKKSVETWSITPLTVSAPIVYMNANDGTQDIALSALGLSGTVEDVFDANKNGLLFTTSSGSFKPTFTVGGEQAIIVKVNGEYYQFNVIVVTKILKTKSDITSFIASSQNGYFELGANIDMESSDVNCSNANTFTGTFDGCGYAIFNAIVKGGGLFGNVAEGSIVKNVGFVNATNGYSGAGGTFGDKNYGTIDNCYVDMPNNGSNGQTYACVSGICNLNYGTIQNCIVKVAEHGNDEHKQICQYNYAAIKNVYCLGTETALTYDLPGQYTANDYTTSSTITDAKRALFNNTAWNISAMSGVLPTFKALSYDLVANSLSDYGIIYGQDKSGANPAYDTIDYQAALELQKYFMEATGVELPITDKANYAAVTGTKKHFISLGYTYQFNNAGLTPSIDADDNLGLGETGFIIDTINGNVYISGYLPNYSNDVSFGTLFGVYKWLNLQFGLEIFADDAYIIDKGFTDKELTYVSMISVPDIDVLIGGNGDSINKNVMGYIQENGGYTTKNVFYGAYGPGSIRPYHNFLDWLPQSETQSKEGNPNGVAITNFNNFVSTYQLTTAPKNNFNDGYTYYFDNVYSNPGDSTRNVYDICLSSENQDNLVAALVNRMSSQYWIKNSTSVSFSHEDGSFWCPHCRQKYANNVDNLKSKYATEQEYITALYTEFMIKLANAMAENDNLKNLDLVLLFYGLASSLPVSGTPGNYSIDSGIQSYLTSEGLSLPSNLVVAFCYGANNNYDGETDFTAQQDMIERWNTITDKFFFWTYVENYSNYFAPFDGLQQIQDSMKFAVNSGAKIYRAQGMTSSGTKSTDWGALENYVIKELSRDVDQNVDSLIAKFMTNYYGSAASAMTTLYTSYKAKMEALFESYGFGGSYNKLTDNGTDYISTTCWSKAELEGFLNQIDAAKVAANGDETILKRIAIEEITFKYMYIKLYTSDAATRYSKSEMNLKSSFISDCKELGITNFAESILVDKVFD